MQVKPLKILIIRFSSIGDIVLTTPVVRCLKEQRNCEIHYITKKSFLSLLSDNPYIDKIWSFKNHLDEILQELSLHTFDYIIDLHKNIRSAIVKRRLKTQSYSFYKANIAKWLIVNFKIDKLPNLHIVDRYLETVAPLGVKNDGKGLDFFISDQHQAEADLFLKQHKITTPYIAIVLGAQYATKVPTNDFFISLCKQIQAPIIFIGGPAEQEKGNMLTNQLGKNIISSAGQLSIGGSAAIINQSDWIVSPDTGMMHIAAALNKNIISIWGSTIPQFGMTPYHPIDTTKQSIIIENSSLKCRPCSKIGFGKCPKKHFNCMSQIEPSEVLKVLNTSKFDIKG